MNDFHTIIGQITFLNALDTIDLLLNIRYKWFFTNIMDKQFSVNNMFTTYELTNLCVDIFALYFQVNNFQVTR